MILQSLKKKIPKNFEGSFSAFFRFLTFNSGAVIDQKNVALYVMISDFFFVDITMFFLKNQNLLTTSTKKNVVISKKTSWYQVFFQVLDSDITIKRWFQGLSGQSKGTMTSLLNYIFSILMYFLLHEVLLLIQFSSYREFLLT